MSEKDMQDLLDLVERTLGRKWLDLVDWLRDQNALDDIDRRLAAGDREGVIQKVKEAAEKYASDIHDGYVQGGKAAAEWLDKGVDGLVRFDVTNTNAVAWAKKNAAELVQGLAEEQRDTAKQVIADGIAAGDNPRAIAADLRASIGLTPKQAEAVASYRRALEQGDFSNALGRELRDARGDRTLLAAQRDGTELSQATIDRMVDRYRENYVTYRATTIARTETLTAVHAGCDEAFQQAIDRGDVDGDALVGQWNPGPATKDARDAHRTADLLAQRPKVGDTFVLDDGTEMEYPGDPAGGAENNANCRCCRSMRLDLSRSKRASLPEARVAS